MLLRNKPRVKLHSAAGAAESVPKSTRSLCVNVRTKSARSNGGLSKWCRLDASIRCELRRVDLGKKRVPEAGCGAGLNRNKAIHALRRSVQVYRTELLAYTQ